MSGANYSTNSATGPPPTEEAAHGGPAPGPTEAGEPVGPAATHDFDPLVIVPWPELLRQVERKPWPDPAARHAWVDEVTICWQPAKLGQCETREIRGRVEV